MKLLRTIRCWLFHRKHIELKGFDHFNQYCCRKCDSWLNRVAISADEEMGYHAARESIEKGEMPRDLIERTGMNVGLYLDDFDRGWIRACKEEMEKEKK